MYWTLDGKIVRRNKSFQLTEIIDTEEQIVNYKSDWHTKYSDKELEAKGLIKVEEPGHHVQPDIDHRLYELVSQPVGQDGLIGFDIVDRGMDVAIELYKATVSQKSKQFREIGIEFNSIRIKSDAEAISLLVGGKIGGKASRKVVTKNGRIEVTASEFDVIVNAVDDHVQSVFDHEYDLLELIDAAIDIPALELVDIDTGWPGEYLVTPEEK